jgi:hypothetical protein
MNQSELRLDARFTCKVSGFFNVHFMEKARTSSVLQLELKTRVMG